REQKLDEHRAELDPELDVSKVLRAQVAIVDGEIDELTLLVIEEGSDQSVEEGVARDPAQIALADDELQAAPHVRGRDGASRCGVLSRRSCVDLMDDKDTAYTENRQLEQDDGE